MTTPDRAADPDPLDPDQAQDDPRRAVEALEQRVLGEPGDRLDDGPPAGETGDAGEAGDKAVFAIDLDPEDQGTADAVPPAPE